MTSTLTIPRPDDWHLHLRDSEVLEKVLPYTSQRFGRAIVMPNLQPPVVTTADAQRYREEIMSVLPAEHEFEPLMTLYLTEQTDPQDVRQGFETGQVTAVKLYPAGATTNSAAGVRNLESVYPVLDVMQEIGMPLLIHGEVVDAEIDIFDREAVFIEQKLSPLRNQFPALKIVLEHVTTKDGIDYIKSCAENTAGTLTPHHIIINRNALLVGGIKPHYYCLPVAKRESHRLALLAAAVSGDPRFFLGTDSAPHLDGAKESACGCAGVFNVANTMEMLAQVFENENSLDKLSGFTSEFGPAFYGLPVNQEKLLLERQTVAQPLPEKVITSQGEITVFDPQIEVYWQIK